MSCCTRTSSLAKAWTAGSSAAKGTTQGSTQLHAVPPGPVFFEYVGRTGLTVVGSQTNKRYRFDFPGAKVEIAAADVPSIARVPTLRRIG